MYNVYLFQLCLGKEPTVKYTSRTSMLSYHGDDDESSEEISFSLQSPGN